MIKAPQDRYLKVGMINARYWTEGSQGTPVILIHGIGAYVEDWLPSFHAVSTNHRVYAVDLPGHGRTDKPLTMSYRVASLAYFIKDFMAALEIEHAHLVGHSLGGAIGTYFALAFPEAVSKLGLVASAGLGKEALLLLRIATLPVFGELLTRPSRAGSAALSKISVYDPAMLTSELSELNYRMRSQTNAHKCFMKALRASANLCGQRKDIYSPNVRGIDSITNSVLIVWGRQDKVIPAAHAERAAKTFPHARVQIFENCGHLPMLEHTAAFNQLLLEFLNS